MLLVLFVNIIINITICYEFEVTKKIDFKFRNFSTFEKKCWRLDALQFMVKHIAVTKAVIDQCLLKNAIIAYEIFDIMFLKKTGIIQKKTGLSTDF